MSVSFGLVFVMEDAAGEGVGRLSSLPVSDTLFSCSVKNCWCVFLISSTNSFLLSSCSFSSCMALMASRCAPLIPFSGLDLFAVPMGSPFFTLAWIWPALSAITMFLSIFIMQKLDGNKQQAPGCAKIVPFVIPLLFVWLTLYAPAALGVYYTVFNVISLIQSVFMAKFFGPKTLEAKEEAARIARLEILEKNERQLNE